MNKETFIDGDKTIINTNFYLYLLKQENILIKFEKWLIETFYLYIPEVSKNSNIKKIYDKLQELKGSDR